MSLSILPGEQETTGLTFLLKDLIHNGKVVLIKSVC